ncbi:hypothetical protein N9W34_05945 [Rickettsiales bacterium]|nr:hypothetical protein [Rickettsiales bacterium]
MSKYIKRAYSRLKNFGDSGDYIEETSKSKSGDAQGEEYGRKYPLHALAKMYQISVDGMVGYLDEGKKLDEVDDEGKTALDLMGEKISEWEGSASIGQESLCNKYKKAAKKVIEHALEVYYKDSGILDVKTAEEARNISDEKKNGFDDIIEQASSAGIVDKKEIENYRDELFGNAEDDFIKRQEEKEDNSLGSESSLDMAREALRASDQARAERLAREEEAVAASSEADEQSRRPSLDFSGFEKHLKGEVCKKPGENKENINVPPLAPPPAASGRRSERHQKGRRAIAKNPEGEESFADKVRPNTEDSRSNDKHKKRG